MKDELARFQPKRDMTRLFAAKSREAVVRMPLQASLNVALTLPMPDKNQLHVDELAQHGPREGALYNND